MKYGMLEILELLKLPKNYNQLKKSDASNILLRGVYGNIDGNDVRGIYPEKLIWSCEDVTVWMTHIGGHPDKYAPKVKAEIYLNPPKLFISGHSHILLKVMYDDKIGCLHMNPGAAGKQGWHAIRTLLRFTIEGANIKDCEVIELGKR